MRDTKGKGKRAAPATAISRRRVRCFRAVLVLLPVLILGGLEVGLHLIGYGSPPRAFLERDVDGRTICLPNSRFTWRFFPRQIARPIDDGVAFEKHKRPHTFRVFVLGGSAAMGTPDARYGFGEMLRVMLDDRHPGTEFEVINAAIVAVNSHVMLEVAKDCARYDPDVFIVYLGNNEVVGPYGTGTTLTSTPASLARIRANIAIRRTRIGQLFASMVDARHGTARVWNGMAMFLDQQVRHDSPGLASVYESYERNLQDICSVARAAGASIVVSTVGVNLRNCAPFASLNRKDLTGAERTKWDEYYRAGTDQESRGQVLPAIESYQAATAIDGTYAELQFRLARACLPQPDAALARQHFGSALEYDTLRFRADAGINGIIRSVTEGREGDGIHFVDSVSALEAGSPHGIPGNELFHEHVHLNFTGNYLVARSMIPAIDRILGPRAAPGSVKPVLAEAEVAERLVYTDFDRLDVLSHMKTMMSRPPFTDQLNHAETMGTLDAEIKGLRERVDIGQCLRLYEDARRAHPDEWRLLLNELYIRKTVGMERDLDAEERQLRPAVEAFPYNRRLCNTLAKNLYDQGRLREARDPLERLIDVVPNSPRAHYLLARIASDEGNEKAAARHYRRAVSIEPGLPVDIYMALATIYVRNGNTRKAIRTLREGIEVHPDDKTALAHCQLAGLLDKQGKRDEAWEHLDAALRIRPELARMPEFQAQYRRIEGESR